MGPTFNWGGVNCGQICLTQRLPCYRIFRAFASFLIFLCQPWSWILLLLATSWHQIASTFQTSAATKPPSPHFLALFSRNRWNVKCPFYGKKGFYGLTSGRFNRAKCAMSGRSRLNGPCLDGCFGSCVWEACSETYQQLHHEWSLSAPNRLWDPGSPLSKTIFFIHAIFTWYFNMMPR